MSDSKKPVPNVIEQYNQKLRAPFTPIDMDLFNNEDKIVTPIIVDLFPSSLSLLPNHGSYVATDNKGRIYILSIHSVITLKWNEFDIPEVNPDLLIKVRKALGDNTVKE